MAAPVTFLSTWLRRRLPTVRACIAALVALMMAVLLLAPVPLILQGTLAESVIRRPRDFLWQMDILVADKLAQSGRKTSRNPDLVFLGIDNASTQLDSLSPEVIEQSPVLKMMKESGWPWPRAVYATIVDRLAAAGAKVIILDLLFGVSKPGDAQLQEALERQKDRTIIGANLTDNLDPHGPHKALQAPAETVMPSRDISALVTFSTDPYGVIRKALFHTKSGDTALGRIASARTLDSVAARTLTLLGQGDKIPNDSEEHWFRFTGGAGSFFSKSVYEIFDERSWKLNFQDGALLKDKVVMVGPHGNFQQDSHPTPLGGIDGAEIHLHTINAALQGQFLDPIDADDPWTVLLLIIGGATLAWGLRQVVPNILTHSAAVITVGAAYVVGAQRAFDHGVILAFSAPLGTFFLATLAAGIVEFLVERSERLRIRRMFSRYVNRKIVEQLEKNPEEYYEAMGGKRLLMAVLFSDLRGFTSLTENADPVQLVSELNEYMQRMNDAVFAGEGVLDKFIGDAVMAHWGAFTFRDKPVEAACDAVRTALRMLKGLESLNVERTAAGKVPFAMGIGINFGDLIFGNIGSESKTDFTVIGDNVNLASRMEGTTKEYGVPLLISESLAEQVRPFFHLQTVDSVRVKGKKKPVGMYTVLGAIDEPLPPDRMTYLGVFEQAMIDYRAGRFAIAKKGFAKCRALIPKDEISAIFEERCADFEINPPPDPWDGVYTMTKK